MPFIVAETLELVSDPLLTGLGTGPVEPPADIAHALAWSLLPEEDASTPPAWLLPGQIRSFRRVLAAIRRFGGALLADPVGSGKTYVALAVAATLQRRKPTACVVPASLASQWAATAKRLGIAVEIASHEQASRGRLPGGTSGLVIIDESHHFRNPATRRYRTVAPWLVGRPVLLVTATPLVNRHSDLAHQLGLAVRDDALALDGLTSLRRGIDAGAASASLARLVVEERTSQSGRPERESGTSAADDEEGRQIVRALTHIDRLTLSRNGSIAALVRGVLYRAAGSSPAALLGALRRYRSLLHHARDALACGRMLGRSELRRFAGEVEEQLVLWSVIGGEATLPELELEDLKVLESVISNLKGLISSPDTKVERLATILSDHQPTIVFVARRETVRYLRDRLADGHIAWCTGDRAGLGHTPVPRHVVLGWFRPSPRDSSQSPAPASVLIATDVAAEGLDLQAASRIVHYDSPWTPMRLEQREGRALRLGSEHESVQVIRFIAPRALEDALDIESRLARKASLPSRAGLGDGATPAWSCWRDLAGERESRPGMAGVGFVRSRRKGTLAGFGLYAQVDGSSRCLATIAGWLSESGEWCEDPRMVTQLLREAMKSEERRAPEARRIRSALGGLAGPIRSHLSAVRGRCWSGVEPDPAVSRLSGRLLDAVRHAARHRNVLALQRLERAMAFVSGGHTAGEAMLVNTIASLSDGELAGVLVRLPAPSPKPDALLAKLHGLLIFGE